MYKLSYNGTRLSMKLSCFLQADYFMHMQKSNEFFEFYHDNTLLLYQIDIFKSRLNILEWYVFVKENM